MSLTIEQTEAAIRETFYNMEEGVEYVLNDFWFQQANQVREKYHYSLLKDKHEYKFTRKGDEILINNNFVFDFARNSNLTLAFPFAFPLAFAFAFAFAFALQHSGFEKLNKNTCEGKIIEVDGKKYKLTAV